MKPPFKFLFQILTCGALLALVHCRTEELELIVPKEEDVLKSDSAAASLIQRTVSNDGSADNIIDRASCLKILLPVSLLVNGQEVTIESLDDLQQIEDIFDQSALDTDTLEIIYPIEVQTVDYRVFSVGSDQELEEFRQPCTQDQQTDSDIECIDFDYPIVASVFNTGNQLIETLTFQADQELFEFIDDLDEDDLVTLAFPIYTTLADGTRFEARTLSELLGVIEASEESCDEDDDFDFDDDDCDDCDETTFAQILTSCNVWSIDSFERRDEDLEDLYEDAELRFRSDWSFTVFTETGSLNGNWSLSPVGDALFLELLIAGLPDLEGLWEVHDLNRSDDEVRIDLRINGEDRLRLESDCELD